MANSVVMMHVVDRQEEQQKYTDFDGTLYIFRLRSEDNAKDIEFIWCNAPAPNSNTKFDDMSKGSLLFDLADSGLIYYKNADTAFGEVGDLT